MSASWTPVATVSRGRLLRAPLLVGVGGVAALTLLHVRDPHDAGSYGYCPYLLLTGHPCPGCGGLRAANLLTNGDWIGALSSNAMAVGLLLFLAGTAQAAGSSMPWEGPLQSILESIQGPVARIVAVIIIIATGLALAFGDTSGGFRKLIQIVFGLSIAFAASSFFLSFFSFSGGAVV